MPDIHPAFRVVSRLGPSPALMQAMGRFIERSYGDGTPVDTTAWRGNVSEPLQPGVDE
jgi:hypothetical protein